MNINLLLGLKQSPQPSAPGAVPVIVETTNGLMMVVGTTIKKLSDEVAELFVTSAAAKITLCTEPTARAEGVRSAHVPEELLASDPAFAGCARGYWNREHTKHRWVLRVETPPPAGDDPAAIVAAATIAPAAPREHPRRRRAPRG